MSTLEDVTVDDLRETLAQVEGKKPTQRVMAAINYLEEDEATNRIALPPAGFTRAEPRGGMLAQTQSNPW